MNNAIENRTSYANWLRTTVGDTPLIFIAVGVVLFDETGKLLLQKRPDGEWGIPGGHLEPGESLEEAAVREVREETGLQVDHFELLGIASGQESVIEQDGVKTYYVTTIYRAHNYSGVPTAGAESLDVNFFALDALPQPLSKAVTGVLKHLGVPA